MDVKFLDARSVETELQSLIEIHDEFHWAVAWGDYNSTAKKALARPKKFKAVTFGLSFSHSDPRLIKELVGMRGAYVVKTFEGGTYHPKIYAFKTGDQVCAIVGSANFTHGGLVNNHEAAIMMTGTLRDRALADVLDFCQASADLGGPVTDELAERYRLSCERAARLPRPRKDPLDGIPADRVKALSSPLVAMSWSEYARAIRESEHHTIDKSLELLRIAQTWFASVESFSDLTSPQRKAIAGILGSRERESDTELDRDWGWFGSMRGAGDFSNRIAENDDHLAKAVDSIPLRGEVTREIYEIFVEHFLRAFDSSDRVGGVATASRLLAIKRPDVFLCVSSPNRREAAKEMSFPPTTLELENYWDRVIEVVRASNWYNSPKPPGRAGALWESRVAMLDAIFYRPG